MPLNYVVVKDMVNKYFNMGIIVDPFAVKISTRKKGKTQDQDHLLIWAIMLAGNAKEVTVTSQIKRQLPYVLEVPYYIYTVTFAFTYYFTSVTCTDSSQCGQGERCNIALDAPDGDCREIVDTRAIYIQTGIMILWQQMEYCIFIFTKHIVSKII